MKKYLRFVFFISFLFFSCKKVYDPEINDVPNVLVVDGLITNELKAHTIHLSNAIRFDVVSYNPETGATVYVSDNNGNTFNFGEKTPGYYTSDPLFFIPQIGAKYTLTVETKNKKIYKSSEQELLSKITLNEVTNLAKWIRYYLTIDGSLQYLNVKGTEFYTTFDLLNVQNPYFRFSNSVIAEYFSTDKGFTYFCWRKQNLNDYFNLNNNQYNNSGQFQHDLGFCPIDTFFYSIRDLPAPLGLHQVINKYIVSFKQYHLNEEIHNYYQSLNKQLEANQRIFDPLSFQIEGNLKCISDPNEQVFGLFETSSVNILTYAIDYNILSNSTSYVLQKINPIDFENIPNSGTDSLQPKFWIK